MDYDGLNPDDPLDRVIGWACEAERRQTAAGFLRQYERGTITVRELGVKLGEVCEQVQPLGSGS